MARPPNLLFIYTDEQAFNTLEAYGNTQIDMPNLNRLARSSYAFEKAYVTQPVCTPSRSSLLTGLYPHTSGCSENNKPLPEDVQCLPEMLETGKYATAHIGKWHLGDELFAQHGFDHWISVEDEYQKYFSPGRDKSTRSSYHQFLLSAGLTPDGTIFSRKQSSSLAEEFGKPAFVGNESAKYIREHKNEPFALYVNFFEPHMPFFGPRDDQYSPGDIPLPDNYSHELDVSNPLKTRIMKEQFYRHGHSGLALETDDDWRRMIANYWGLCSLVDTYVGTIVDTLEDCGLSDDTMIVFTSDHGDMMGAHKLLTKGFMFEEAARVPLLVKLPGQKNGKVLRGNYSQIDVVPTILDYLGADTPKHLQGKSLRPIIECDGRIMPTDDVIMEWSGGNNGLGDHIGKVSTRPWMHEKYATETIEVAMRDPVRTIYTQDGWKFNHSPLGEHELYNLNDDPLERFNLVNSTDRTFVNQLVQRIAAWQQSTNDMNKVREL